MDLKDGTSATPVASIKLGLPRPSAPRKRNTPSKSVRIRKADKSRELYNKRTMELVAQRTQAYRDSFRLDYVKEEVQLTDGVFVKLDAQPEPFPIYDDDDDYIVDNLKELMMDDHEIDCLAELEELFEGQPREVLLKYYSSIEPILELHRQALKLPPVQPVVEQQPQPEVVECGSTSPTYSPFSPPPQEKVEVVENEDKGTGIINLLGAPVYKPAMKIRIDSQRFVASTGVGGFSPKFSADRGVIIYAGPGNGKSFLLDRLPEDVRKKVHDTDEWDAMIDQPSIVVTNRHDVVELNPTWFRIAFVPPKLVWNARCVSKCGKWQTDWYPPPGAKYADFRFTGTGFLSDYLTIV